MKPPEPKKPKKKAKKKSTTICQKCSHDMGRSKCKFIGNGKWEVKCNKCKTVYDISMNFPPREKV